MPGGEPNHDDHLYDMLPVPGPEPMRVRRGPSPWMRVAVVAAVVAIIAAALVLNASGDDDATEVRSDDANDVQDGAAAAFASVASSTLEEGSARVSLTSSYSSGGEDTVTGVISFGQPTAGELEVGNSAGAGTMRWIGEELWAQMPGDDVWYDLSAVIEDQSGISLEGTNLFAIVFEYTLLGFESVDPSTVVPLGSEQIDGVHTEGYRATFDFRKVIELRGTVLDAEVADEFFNDAVLEGETWIDEQGRARRVVFTEDRGQTTEITFDDFGVEVQVERPTNVVDFDEYGGFTTEKFEEVGEAVEPPMTSTTLPGGVKPSCVALLDLLQTSPGDSAMAPDGPGDWNQTAEMWHVLTNITEPERAELASATRRLATIAEAIIVAGGDDPDVRQRLEAEGVDLPDGEHLAWEEIIDLEGRTMEEVTEFCFDG